MIITKAKETNRIAIVNLLKSNNLPMEDLPAVLDFFYVAVEEDQLVGLIGMELYSSYALLRSMVVSEACRNKNIASQLVQQLENDAIAIGIECIYLLTETARQYFERKGYKKIEREEVPLALQQSSEFSHVCPRSAIVMKKSLTS